MIGIGIGLHRTRFASSGTTPIGDFSSTQWQLVVQQWQNITDTWN